MSKFLSQYTYGSRLLDGLGTGNLRVDGWERLELATVSECTPSPAANPFSYPEFE
jgi:hypothetical protein